MQRLTLSEVNCERNDAGSGVGSTGFSGSSFKSCAGSEGTGKERLNLLPPVRWIGCSDAILKSFSIGTISYHFRRPNCRPWPKSTLSMMNLALLQAQPNITRRSRSKYKATRREGTRRSTTYSGQVLQLDCLLPYLSAVGVQVYLRSDGPPKIANDVFPLRANLTPQRSSMDRHYSTHLYFLAVDEDLLGMVERRRSRRSRRGTFPASNGQLGLLLGRSKYKCRPMLTCRLPCEDNVGCEAVIGLCLRYSRAMI